MEKFSWKNIGHNQLVKNLDYSCFKYNTTVIPNDFYYFFNINSESDKKISIQLLDKDGNTYDTYIRYTREKSPVRMLKWNKDFSNYLKTEFQSWDQINQGDKPNHLKLIFHKTDRLDTFKISTKNIDFVVEDSDSRYFIFDTGVTGQDIDFEQYSWERSRFNKVRTGDYFLYRRPNKVSENKKFYFFGSGRVGEIQGTGDEVICKVEKPIRFNNLVNMDDLMDYKWNWKERTRDDYQHFFNFYGMNLIPYEDFLNINKLGMGDDLNIDFEEENKDLVQSHIKLLDVSSGKVGKPQITTSRGSLGKIFSDNVRTVYDNKCCVTGISTRSMLESSHISPWSDDEENRGNVRNGLLLSLILHKCFDKGLISIDDNYKVIVSENIKDKNLKNYLNELNNKKINLPVRKEYYPDKELLKKHRKKWSLKKNTTQRSQSITVE